jgi:hypothetical protein
MLKLFIILNLQCFKPDTAIDAKTFGKKVNYAISTIFIQQYNQNHVWSNDFVSVTLFPVNMKRMDGSEYAQIPFKK